MPTFHTLQGASAADPARPHLILVGLPGAGKTTVGESTAQRLGRPFLDFDREIERREGASVAQIFAERGEAYFRQRERELTAELATVGGMVLSPGGGWITNSEVVALLRPPGRIIYLDVTPATALRRLGPERGTRPLLARADPLAEIERLYEQRRPVYAAADHTVNTEIITAQQVIDRVVELASTFWGGYVTP